MIQCIDRFFHFSYLRQDVRGMPQIHELRDGHAFAELAMLLRMGECRYGGLLLNYPAPAGHVKIPDLTSTDLLVLTTRPPLSDDELDSRPIRRSGTPLERIVLESVRQALRICRRSCVILSEEMARRLPEHYRSRGEMEFTLNGPACYRRYRTPYTKKKPEHQWCIEPAGSLRTCAFVVHSNAKRRHALECFFHGRSGHIDLVLSPEEPASAFDRFAAIRDGRNGSIGDCA